MTTGRLFPAHRERGLRDNSAAAARCQGIILAGTRLASEGMRRERDACVAGGGRALDIGSLGLEPTLRGVLEPSLTPWQIDLVRKLASLHHDA